MAEAAGLVLTAVALFSRCLQGYELLESIRRRNKDTSTLLCCLEIEEKRLLLFGRNTGLVDGSCTIPARELDTVVKVLKQIEEITQDAATLKQRYGFQVEDGPKEEFRVDKMEYMVLPPDHATKARKPPKTFGIRIMGLTVRWLFERKGFEKLVHDLRQFNDGLNALLQESQLRSLRRDFEMITLRSTATDNVDVLRTIREAARDQYQNLSRTSDQRVHFLELKGLADPPQRSPQVLPPLVPIASVKPKSDDVRSTRCLADIDGRVMLVEWRRYRGESGPVVDLLRERVRSLATLLGRTPKPDFFRTLDCTGYTHDEVEERFGLVYSIPIPGPNPPTMVSLQDLLSSRLRGDMPLPTLQNRFRLAAALARSLLQLHSAKWVHRNLHGGNVVFLRTAQSNQNLYVSPYICGFEYSREDEPGAVSLPVSSSAVEAPYQHPDLASRPRRGYHREFDAYSLGVVLLEIGFWRPIADFHKAQYSPHRNRERLLKYQLQGDLAHRMGEEYETAVKLLLSDTAYGREAEEGNRLVHFFQNIVLPVEEMIRGG